jgi:GT2 family glycosyltransferase
VIVNYHGGRLLLDCIASLREQCVDETIVVDNGSADGSVAAAVAAFPDVEVLAPGRNLGFAGGANLGASAARGRLLLLLNPDIRLPPGAVTEMAARFADPRVGVLAPPLRVETSATVEYGATIDVIGSPVGLTRPASPVYVPGCALMTRSALFRGLDGFDDRFFMFVEDVDYCWRVLLSGFDVTVPTIAPAWHFGGATAPGGYIEQESLSSTLFRVALRERNTLAMLLKCYAGPLAFTITPMYIAQSLLTAAALAARGRRRTALAILAGLRWNVRELPRTLAVRRRVQVSRKVRDTVILRRMYRGVWKLHLLMRFGIPPVSENPAAPAGSDRAGRDRAQAIDLAAARSAARSPRRPPAG